MMPQEIKDLLIGFSKSKFFKFFIIVLFFVIGLMSILIFNQPKDNLLVQISEEVIKIETGVDFHFTPEMEGK